MTPIGTITDKNGKEYTVRYSASNYNGRTRYVFDVFDEISGVDKGTLELDAYDGDQYAEIDQTYLEPSFRGLGIYPALLYKVRDFIKIQGLKGVFSKGSLRNSYADKAWDRIHDKTTTVDREYKDYTLENKNNKYTMITTINEFKNTINEDHDNKNYMVLGNINKISRMISELESLIGDANLDEWAKDHIATSADDIEEVYNFLKSKNESSQLPGMSGANPIPAICMDPIQEAAARDHYIVIVGDNVVNNGTKEAMTKIYNDIKPGDRPSQKRSMYKLVKEDK